MESIENFPTIKSVQKCCKEIPWTYDTDNKVLKPDYVIFQNEVFRFQKKNGGKDKNILCLNSNNVSKSLSPSKLGNQIKFYKGEIPNIQPIKDKGFKKANNTVALPIFPIQPIKPLTKSTINHDQGLIVTQQNQDKIVKAAFNLNSTKQLNVKPDDQVDIKDVSDEDEEDEYEYEEVEQEDEDDEDNEAHWTVSGKSPFTTPNKHENLRKPVFSVGDTKLVPKPILTIPSTTTTKLQDKPKSVVNTTTTNTVPASNNRAIPNNEITTPSKNKVVDDDEDDEEVYHTPKNNHQNFDYDESDVEFNDVDPHENTGIQIDILMDGLRFLTLNNNLDLDVDIKYHASKLLKKLSKNYNFTYVKNENE